MLHHSIDADRAVRFLACAMLHAASAATAAAALAVVVPGWRRVARSRAL